MRKPERAVDPRGDPDKTNPPTPVEELWGCPHCHDTHAPLPDGHGPRTDAYAGAAIALRGNDAMTLYWSARDCLEAGVYPGATALLRRLIVHLAEERADEVGTRREAERLLALTEMFLGRPPDPPGERAGNA